MNQNKNGYGKQVWSLLVLAVFGFSIFSPSAEARLIFTTEDDGVESDVYTLDVDGTVNVNDNTDLSLNFGANLGASITYNDSTDQFTFTNDVNLSGNSLEDVRVENLATDPAACTTAIEGRIYYNTTDDEIKYCDGTAWQGFADGTLSESLADGNVFVGNGSGVATGVAVSGDATIDNTGALSLATDSVDSAEIATDAVDSDEIAADAVTASELADDAVDTAAIVDDAVTADKIADDAIGDDAIDYSAVTLSDFTNDLSLTSAQIFVGDGSNVATAVSASGDVTLDNAGAFTIADNSVDGTDIALGGDTAGDTMYYDGTDWVRLAIGTAGQELKVNGGGTAPSWVTDSSLGDSLADGNVFVGNGSGVATGVVLSGDATIDNTGALSLATDSVDSAEIATGAVGTDEIADGTVSAADLGTDSVGTDEISSGAVGTDEIADGTVSAADLATDSVDSDEIAADAVGDSEIDYSAVTLSDFTNDLSLTSAQIFVGDGSNVATAVSASGDVTLDNAGAFTIADNSVDGTDIALGGDTAGDTMYYDGTDWVRLAIGTAGQVLSTNGGGTAPVWEDAAAGDLAGLTDTNITGAAAGNILVYDAVNSEWDNVAVSGDATIDNTGALSLATDSVDSAEIATDAVDSDEIAADAVTASELADDAVDTAAIVDDAVTADKIADDAIGDDAIDYSAVTLSDFTNDLSLTSAQIFVGDGSNVATAVSASGDVTLDNAGAFTIADNSVDGTDIALGGDTAGDTMYYDGTDWVRLAIGTAGQELKVNGGGTAPSWVTDSSLGDSLADGNVFVGNGSGVATGVVLSGDATIDNTGALSLATDSVDSAEIATGAVGTDEIADGTVSAADLGTDSVGTDEISSGAVGTDEIADGTVSAADLATDSVDSDEIAADAVGDSEIDYSAVTLSDFTNDLSLTSAQIFVGDGSNVATAVSASGDVTLDNAGAFTIADNSVDGTDIALGGDTAGDTMYYDGTDWVRLAAGTAGQILATNAATDAVEWIDNASEPVDVSVAMPPEFPNFTITADGSNNRGTLESDYDATNNRNYYQWTTRKSAMHDYDLVVQWPIPEDFVDWQDDPISFDYRTNTATDTDNQIDLVSILDTAGTSITLAGDTADLADAAWATADVTGVDSAGVYTAGEFITITFKLQSTKDDFAQLGAMQFNYTAK